MSNRDHHNKSRSSLLNPLEDPIKTIGAVVAIIFFLVTSKTVFKDADVMFVFLFALLIYILFEPLVLFVINGPFSKAVNTLVPVTLCLLIFASFYAVSDLSIAVALACVLFAVYFFGFILVWPKRLLVPLLNKRQAADTLLQVVRIQATGILYVNYAADLPPEEINNKDLSSVKSSLEDGEDLLSPWVERFRDSNSTVSPEVRKSLLALVDYLESSYRKAIEVAGNPGSKIKPNNLKKLKKLITPEVSDWLLENVSADKREEAEDLLTEIKSGKLVV